MEGASWDEDSYGILKRWVVFRAWVERHAKRRGLSRLSVLDYGCGTGALVTYPLALLGHTVLGSDIHGPSIDLARTRYQLPNLSFAALPVEALLEQPNRFDVIVCSEILEHLARPEDFLRSLSRLVVPNGIVIITTPNGYGSYELCCALERGLKRCGADQCIRRVHQLLRPPSHQHGHTENDDGHNRGTMGYLNLDSGHIQFFRRRKLEQLFHGAGFVVVDRRARTLLCGPYLDQLLARLPFRSLLYRFNGRLADSLPFSWAADWMFLLERREKSAM
jgi:2-polyprenyl-3-methyl-5-hydroxy-6-metoxy-1,4-benzoquinol methylase